jgi:putative DeoR family transcriptional regulator (stage III sporulation protein D)
MVTDSYNRAIILGEYIATTGATVRQCAKQYGISKSTVHSDVTKRLGRIDRVLWEKVRCVLNKNKTERHLRGGEATKNKYLSMRKN